MKTKNNESHEELIDVLNKIRAELYPDIPESLIKDIVEAESKNQDDPVEGRKASRKVIDAFLKSAVSDVEEE